MKRWTTIWASFPAEHKKRFYQGLGGYLLLCAAVGTWIAVHSTATVKDWQSRIPSASAVIKPLVVTLQATPASDQQAVADRRIYISLIITDLGLSARNTEKALNELPKEITLAFSPYAEALDIWLKKAAALNRETLITLPMESAAYPQDDAGPRGLSSRLSDKDNADNLNWILKQSKGTIGVINFMGSRFLSDKKRLAPVFDTLLKNGDVFIEIMPAQKSEAAGIAAQIGLPYMAADLKIDSDTNEAAIQDQLAKLEKIALERGYAIAVAEPYPISLNMIKSWASTLAKQGITLAPLATVWKNKPHDQRPAPAPEQAPK